MLDDDQPGTPSNTTGTPAGGGTPDTAPAKKAAAKKATAKKAAAKTTASKTVAKKATAKKATAKKTAAPVAESAPAVEAPTDGAAPAKKAAAKKATAKKAPAKKAPAKKAAPKKAAAVDASGTAAAQAPAAATGTIPLFQAPEKGTAPARRTRKAAEPKPAADSGAERDGSPEAGQVGDDKPVVTTRTRTRAPAKKAAASTDQADSDQGGEKSDKPAARSGGQRQAGQKQGGQKQSGGQSGQKQGGQSGHDEDDDQDDDGQGGPRRRRRRGGRRRRKPGDGEGDDSSNSQDDQDDDQDQSDSDSDDEGDGESASSRRRRRRRRAGEEGDAVGDDPQNTVTRVRKTRSAEDQITAVSGSTRLEAKKQRRREGREAGRRRAPIVSEAEFLARRESVDRVMVIRQREDLTQIAVMEDKVLVEHYVARESQTSLIGNVYLGRVQNVLPSMEAAFIDIGKGRNAVLYAGEVNWQALGHKDGQPRKIESVLSSGQPILVQVTKDPIGHKGARLSSQVSLAGRFLVYVPDGTTSGISRKLPDTERSRLKTLLKEIVPDSAGVIVRTAAEGASEDELTRDVERLKARWEDIEKKTKGNAPQLLYGEPDLTLKVVRDLFTEDFTKLVIEGDEAWDTVQNYVSHVAPDLEERLERYDGDGKDAFTAYRIDEQIAKGLDRKVWLPSGGSLVIDRTEAMTVVDVNTGKFTGSGGNLEETVTKNNLEAAEEIVRQLRLRDIGGIIVVDFIDMVLESNRDLVLRRLVECLGRDRTRHQVAEVTSLGLVQMTRKRIGTGLLEAFSENCEHCQGRGITTHDAPVEQKKGDDDSRRSSGSARRGRGGRGGDQDSDSQQDSDAKDSGQKDSGNQKSSGNQRSSGNQKSSGGRDSAARKNTEKPSPKDVAAMPRHEGEPAQDEPVQSEPAQDTAAKSESKANRARDQKSRADEPQAEPKVDGATAEPVSDQPTVSRRQRQSRPVTKVAAASEAPETSGSPADQPEPTPEPVVEAVVEAAPAPAAVVQSPQVITRTRGRSASRPAGPPASAASAPSSSGLVGSPAQTGLVEPGTADAEPGTPADPPLPVVEHVPIKKRGARKR